MDRLDVALVLDQMMSEVNALNDCTRYNCSPLMLEDRTDACMSYYRKQHWWLAVMPGFKFTIKRTYPDMYYEAVPMFSLSKFIDFIYDGTNHSTIPDILKNFPLIRPEVSTYNINI